MQHLALHAGTGRLYSLMHVGGEYTHKDPGTEVWVYDLAGKRRVQRIALKDPATSIAVTRDAKPLLFSIFIGAPEGGRLRAGRREAAAHDRRNRIHTHDAGHVLSPPCPRSTRPFP